MNNKTIWILEVLREADFEIYQYVYVTWYKELPTAQQLRTVIKTVEFDDDNIDAEVEIEQLLKEHKSTWYRLSLSEEGKE